MLRKAQIEAANAKLAPLGLVGVYRKSPNPDVEDSEFAILKDGKDTAVHIQIGDIFGYFCANQSFEAGFVMGEERETFEEALAEALAICEARIKERSLMSGFNLEAA